MRASWTLQLQPADSNRTLVLQTARALVEDIRRRRLRPGDALPGARALAASLGIGRNTVVAAYRELAAEGWITQSQRAAPVVSLDLPARAREFATPPVTLAGEVAFRTLNELPFKRAPHQRAAGTLAMAGGVPDVRLAPRAQLARAWRKVLQGRSAVGALSYGDPRGHSKLRRSIAALLREQRGIPASEENVLIVRGTQMALDLVARAVLAPGMRMAVEDPGYKPAWAAFARTGAALVPVRVDSQGIDVNRVCELAPQAVYLTPHHQYPTTVTLSASRRLALLAWAKGAGTCIIEDDFDHELAYEGRPVLPLASADAHGNVVYVGTLSKVLAPGLRIGYVVAAAQFIERLARDRFVIDRQGDHVTELAVAALIEDGELDRVVRRVRRVYRERRDVLVSELAKRFDERLQFQVPQGGMSMYARVRGLRGTVGAWSARALNEGVEFAPGREFSFGNVDLPFARFGFAALEEREIRDGVARLERAWTVRR